MSRPLRRAPRPIVRALPLAVALAWVPALSQAQEAAPAEAGKLSTVTVTAERRTENIKDVPISVSSLKGEALDVLNASGEDLRMLAGRVPSLNIESSFGRAFPRFYIRGYGNTDFHLNASQPVSLILDDVVQENPVLKGFPIFDTAAVEVLAGPQGTLFGRNTPAGLVKFESVKPGKTFGGYASVSAGTYGTINLEGAVNLPINTDWQARVSAQAQHRDNWVTNESPAGLQTKFLEGHDDNAVRAQLLYGAGTAFSALFNVHARDLDGSARLFRANILKAGTNDFIDGFDPKVVQFDGKNEQQIRTKGANAHLTWKFDGVTLHSITGLETVRSFSRGDVDGGYGAAFLPTGGGPGLIPFPSETADGMSGHSQWTQELRAASAITGPLSWQAGVYLFREKYTIDSSSYDSLGGGALTGVTHTHQRNNAWAVFGSVNYALRPDLTLRGGLRYTHDAKRLSTDPDASLNTTNGLSADTSDGKVTGDVAATWKLDKDVNLYARVATGVRGSSIQPASAFGPQSSAGPETSTSYEVGVKADLFERRARMTANLFHYDVKNQQLSAVGGNSNVTTLVSAKKASGEGAEFTLEAYLTPNLLLGLNGSLNFTKIKDPDLTVFGCAQCTVTDPAGTTAGTFHIDGNSLPQAPRQVANVNLRYGMPTADGELYFYTDWTYRSKINFFLYDSVEFTGKSLTTGGLRVGYIWGNGKYEVAAYGRNITNQVRATGGIDFNNLTAFINEPRMWGAQFKATF